jgi:hypothetical protein
LTITPISSILKIRGGETPKNKGGNYNEKDDSIVDMHDNGITWSILSTS